MAMELTHHQKLAVNSRGKELIVSAAAGSGKTAVLVQRVIGLVCDSENPVDLDRLLVVTFTNAAAAEMRTRIADAISERLAENPSDRRLRRQLALLAESRIQTIHSFCQDLLRRNFALAGVAPDFTLIDQNQSDMLKEQAMERLLEEEYGYDSPGFRLARANICEERGDRRLQGVIMDVYEKLRSHPSPSQWLDYIANRQIYAPEQSGWGRAVIEQAASLLKYATAKIRTVIEELAEYPEVNSKYKPAIDHCLHFGEMLHNALEEGWDAAHQCISAFEKPDMKPAPKGSDKSFTAWVRAERDAFCDAIDAIEKSGLSRSSQRILQEEAQAEPIIHELCRLVSRFEAIYSEIKAGKNSLDFSDLEHMALGLLVDGSKKTPLALELSEYLSEILVDEYQDTNEIQERIFQSLVPEGGSAFFVGDVKQSIYKFRLADPDIFIDRLQSSSDLEALGQSHRTRLALSWNFRSLPPVIDLCNHVFSRIMSRDFGGVDYDETHKLCAVRTGPCGPCEMHIIETDGLRSDDEASEEKATLEARLAVARIAEIMDSEQVLEADGTYRPARPSDFAILLSSYAGKAPYFRKELENAGIPASGQEQEGFFFSTEISVILSLLRAIDNHKQDIPIVAVLRSPLFGFSADDLARVRIAAAGEDIYTAVKASAASGGKKCLDFIGKLDGFSDLAQDMSVSQLVRFLYRDTMAKGVFSAMDNGPARAERLEVFYQMTKDFEAGGATGLHSFLRHVDRLIAADGKMNIPGGTGGVEIMSIHKSKGLEFPFVIIPDAAKQFNRDDSKSGVLFHKDLGLGITIRDAKLRAVFKSASYMAISDAIKREGAFEEMRKLYVALTRARQKTIIIMSLKDAPSKLKTWRRESGESIAPQFLMAQTGAAPWLCAAILDHEGAAPLRALCGESVSPDGGNSQLKCAYVNWRNIYKPSARTEVCEQMVEPHVDYGRLLAMASMEYSHATVSGLPSKITPTGARVLEPDSGEVDGKPEKARLRMFRSAEERLAAGRAAKRGQAIHSFIRRMNLACQADDASISEEILRLTMEGYLTVEDAGMISVSQIQALLASPAMNRVREARQVRREYQFSVMLSPRQLAGSSIDDEQIMLSGSMDILLLNGDSAEIIDFKTDSVAPGAENQAAEKHRLQLELYAKAVEEIFGISDTVKTVFFLKTGAEIQI